MRRMMVSATFPRTLECTLLPVQEADLPALYAFQDDPVLRSLRVVPYRNREAFFAKWKAVLEDHEVVKQTIWADGQLAGSILCFHGEHGRELGILLGRAYWSKGIGSAALTQFLAQLAHLKGPLTARVVEHNTASIRLLEKHHFSRTSDTPFTDAEGNSLFEFVLERPEP